MQCGFGGFRIGIGRGGNFQNRIPVAKKLRLTIDKWDLIKLKHFCKANDIFNSTRQQSAEWEIFNNPKFNRELISKTYKELKKLDNNNNNNKTK